tara:strand:- start:13481 stop:13672 length:192 start_codon:yes stop_codon:yes gene_type:complete
MGRGENQKGFLVAIVLVVGAMVFASYVTPTETGKAMLDIFESDEDYSILSEPIIVNPSIQEID